MTAYNIALQVLQDARHKWCERFEVELRCYISHDFLLKLMVAGSGMTESDCFCLATKGTLFGYKMFISRRVSEDAVRHEDIVFLPGPESQP